jgi:hypothetical protein
MHSGFTLTELHENKCFGHAIRHLGPGCIDEIHDIWMAAEDPLHMA